MCVISSSSSTQISPWDIEGNRCDAAVTAAADLRSHLMLIAAFICSTCRLAQSPFTSCVFALCRVVHTQTSSGEGTASVGSGCDVVCQCAGVQTEETWADAAAAAMTIEGLQQELVGEGEGGEGVHLSAFQMRLIC
jgi:hypothetical protein